jgi:membrane associated rhomboid family serine protease
MVLPMNGSRRDWLAGLVVGVVNGFLFWLFPLAAVLLLVAFAAVAGWQRGLVAGLSGAIFGIGGTWLVVLARSVAMCAQFDAAPIQECMQPDLTAWFIAGLAMLVLGTSLAAIGLRRSR